MLAIASDFCGESRNSAEIKNSLEKIASTGFSHVHWCHEWTGTYLYSFHEMLQIREWCGKLGLAVKGIHASSGEYNCDLKNYISPNDYSRLAGIELVKNRIDLAHYLDAKAIVLHLYLPRQYFKTKKDREFFFRPVLKSFDELEPYCKIRKIKICIENLFEYPPEHTCYMYDTLFSRYDEDYMGLCFDTGHALMACGKNSLEYARRYSDRLFMIHIHDNAGERDEHLIPFEGKFDWEGFAPILARSPYQFPIVIESNSKKTGDDLTWLSKAFKAGRKFSSMVEKHRG